MEPMYECGECGRSVPFDEYSECVDCGKQGAFNFSGDFYCVDCINDWHKNAKINQSSSAEGYVPQPLDNDLVDKIIARNLPLAVAGNHPHSCISFAREIEIEVHKKIKEQLGI